MNNDETLIYGYIPLDDVTFEELADYDPAEASGCWEIDALEPEDAEEDPR